MKNQKIVKISEASRLIGVSRYYVVKLIEEINPKKSDKEVEKVFDEIGEILGKKIEVVEQKPKNKKNKRYSCFFRVLTTLHNYIIIIMKLNKLKNQPNL